MTQQDPIDWAGRKQRARLFILNPPKARRPWSTLTYEYDKAPEPCPPHTESVVHPIGH